MCQNIYAFNSNQQAKQLVQLQSDIKIDSITRGSSRYVDSTNRNDEVNTDFDFNYKITNNTVLNHSYNSEVASNGIDGYYNLSLDIDTSTKIFKTDDLKFRLISMADQNTKMGAESSFISVGWSKTNATKLGYAFSLTHIGKSYDPTLKYIMMKNNLSLNKKLTYRWAANEHSRIKRHGFDLSNKVAWSYSRDLIEHNFLKADWVFETKSANTFKISLFNEYNSTGGSFNILKNIEVPMGRYSNKGVTLRYEMKRPNLLQTNLEFTVRELFNSKGYTFSLDPSWTLSKDLKINTGLNIHDYRFYPSNKSIRIVAPYIKSFYHVNPRLYIDIFAQYNSETNRFAMNSSVGYKLKERHDLYLAHYHNKQSEIANPFENVPSQNSNVLFLKYTYTFAN